MSAANNSVTLNSDGCVEVVIRGDQDYLSFDQLKSPIHDVVNQLSLADKTILGLVDLTGMESYSVGSHKAAFELFQSLPYQKIALFGSKGALTDVTNLVIKATAKEDQIKMFDDRESAIKWLMAGVANSAAKPSQEA